VSWISVAVVGSIALLSTGTFLLSAWAGPKVFRTRSRVDQLTAALNSFVALVLLHQLMPWSLIPPALWLLPVLFVAGGVVGAVLQWPDLPWLRPDRVRWRIAVGVVSEVVVAVALVALLVPL
jgi:hypothetical protein